MQRAAIVGGPGAGKTTAELELAADEAHLPSPPWTSRDVTSDNRFSGGTLAFAGDEEIKAFLRGLDYDAG